MRINSTQDEANREEMLTAIKLYYKKYGFSPTIRELKNITGIKSV
jgi:hypothetical protein